MDKKELKKEQKLRKKEYNKARRKAIRPWKGLAIFLLIVALILNPAMIVLKMFDNTMGAMLGGQFWTLVNEDPNAVYYASDFATPEEGYEAGKELCKTVEAEGAVLLMNNGALPLAEGAKVSTLSSSSVNLVYGGTGSGNVDASKADNMKVAFEKAGMVVNPTLWDWYLGPVGSTYDRSASAGESAVLAGQCNIAEVPMDVYPADVLDSIASYGDAVILTFSRVGGEGYDLEFQAYNYLALDENEQAMLQYASDLKAAGKIKSIIVLINSSNALQVDFLKGNPYGVDAALWIGGVGIRGTNAVAEILTGRINPSGALVDTYCYDNYSSAAMQNFIATTYEGYDGKNIPSTATSYMIYQEGIYVGYKYYETRYEDFVMGTGNAGNYAYGDDVAYPFGHGLSYTTFSFSDMDVTYDASNLQYKVSVKVTNTGDMAGKKTVEVYVNSPYTDYDKENGVEKAAASLVGFGKTGVLEPGASETLTILVNKRDIASYDTYGYGTYILDAGDYYLTAANDAHEAVNNFLAAKGFTPDNTDGRMDAEGNVEMTYTWTEEELDAVTFSTSLNGTPIVNQLSNADLNLNEEVGQTITYLTRNDWVGTWPEKIVQLKLNDYLIDKLQDVQYDPADYPAMEMPTMGAKNGLTLYDMMGLEYDDPAWEPLLDQLTFDEMVSMIGDSFHWRMPVDSVQAPGTRDENGPQGLTAALFGGGLGDVDPTAFTSEDVMAATWNTELMYSVGNMIGNDCLAADVVCLYGPGSNTHRTPYGGRNFEYYSEDGFLAGEIGAAEIKGIQDKGVDVVIKHFALNDCEQDRLGQAAWIGEQAAREIYLKAFQAPFEKGDANGVMTAYTRWGTVWSGGHKGLMTNIMREEWGNDGMSITDNILVTYVTGTAAVLAGVTTCDAMLPYITNELPKYENDPVIVNAMREACHHNLYALVNSSGMNGVGPDTVIEVHDLPVVSKVRTAAIVVDVLFVVCLVLWILGAAKFRKTEVYSSYKTYKKELKAKK